VLRHIDFSPAGTSATGKDVPMLAADVAERSGCGRYGAGGLFAAMEDTGNAIYQLFKAIDDCLAPFDAIINFNH